MSQYVYTCPRLSPYLTVDFLGRCLVAATTKNYVDR